jgi:uncharacterized short protein YbdD (DUF466 family)
MISMAASQLRLAWQFIRTLAGDDAYDRYRAHREACHAGGACMDRKAFYLEAQRKKWNGVNRCC